ncbi:hypothetical protein BKA63DRAFT_404444 [Paraphoma chrysanthemicola]|nr:hypothetical protein BKA63DRAFT_404444 [Paraphoma chrysanthemicola]
MSIHEPIRPDVLRPSGKFDVHGRTPSSSPEPECDDAFHCLPDDRACGTLRICPGLAGRAVGATPLSLSNIDHPGHGTCWTCDVCTAHEHNLKLNQIGHVATSAPLSGDLSFLCSRCELEEMELYYQRMAMVRPVAGVGGAAPSLAFIANLWPQPNTPVVITDVQDFCICRNRWDVAHEEPYQFAEEILRTRTRPVIEGRKQCNLNGGNRPHHVTQQTITHRVARNVGCLCPCGGEPNVQPPGQDYITICLACMGVRIIPNRLPNELLRPAPVVAPRTHGPMRALRRAMWRVNIERGWIPGDPYLNGA